MQDAQLEALKAKHAKSREKCGILKENNQVLSDQLDQTQNELEAQDAAFKRLERQLKLELDRVTQARALAWLAATLSELKLRNGHRMGMHIYWQLIPGINQTISHRTKCRIAMATLSK